MIEDQFYQKSPGTNDTCGDQLHEESNCIKQKGCQSLIITNHWHPCNYFLLNTIADKYTAENIKVNKAIATLFFCKAK